MELISEIVEDWADLVHQVHKRAEGKWDASAPLVAAVILLARELMRYRQWAEEHHST